jgi:hypothetical protein
VIFDKIPACIPAVFCDVRKETKFLITKSPGAPMQGLKSCRSNQPDITVQSLPQRSCVGDMGSRPFHRPL